MKGSWSAVEALLRSSVGRVAQAMVLLVVHSDEAVFEAAYGQLDNGLQQQPTQLSTRFDLASVTKLFTATAFMRLVDQGLVALDQPVANVIPEFAGVRPIGGSEDPLAKVPISPNPAYVGQVVDAGRVTFRQLLTHTSGLPAWRSVYLEAGPVPPAPGEPVADPGVEERIHRALTAIVRYPFIYPPGEDLVYSDIGLILLGESVARLLGKRLDRAVEELVLSPLGLCHTGYRPLDMRNRHQVDDIAATEFCAWRKRRLRGEVHDENAAGMGGVAGHAGLFGTAADVAKLASLYLHGGTVTKGVLPGGRGERKACLLRPETVADMISEQVRQPGPGGVRRGLGWMLRAREGASCGRYFSQNSFGHTGFTGTSVWVDPTVGLIVVLLTNRVYCGRDPAGITALRPALHDAVWEAVLGNGG
ncbi:MAG TPA: carboxylesterase [Anaerolineae bacterium]|nr:carboxylesterase [Anaerolineae bacterium]